MQHACTGEDVQPEAYDAAGQGEPMILEQGRFAKAPSHGLDVLFDSLLVARDKNTCTIVDLCWCASGTDFPVCFLVGA